MRKIFYIFILMVSSFFIFNTSVKADTLSYTIYEKDFELLNDDFLKVRQLAIDYANTNNVYYIITYSVHYYVYFVNESSYPYELNQTDSGQYPRIKITNSSVEKYKYDSGILNFYSSSTYAYLPFYNASYEHGFSYRNLLDTNLSSIYSITGSYNFTINCNDYNYSITGFKTLPSLVNIYEDIYGSFEPEEPEEPEKNENLNSFYLLSIEKIELFANYFITNTTLLFIIGIVILIFIIELIFRRYL